MLQRLLVCMADLLHNSMEAAGDFGHPVMVLFPAEVSFNFFDLGPQATCIIMAALLFGMACFTFQPFQMMSGLPAPALLHRMVTFFDFA